MQNFLRISIAFLKNGTTRSIFDRIIILPDTEYIACACIVLFALVLRVLFFVGFAGGDPQDDGIYLNICKDILKTGFPNHIVQKQQILTQHIINPIYIFPSRLVFVYCTALSLYLLGVNDFAAAFFPLVCSMTSIWLSYKIGALVFTRRTGLYAALVLCLCPLDIIFSTRITPDVPIACFILAGIYFLLKGLLKGNSADYIFSGFFFGFGYLVKETVLIGLLCAGVIIVVAGVHGKWFPMKSFWIVVGILVVLWLEAFYYQSITDFPLLRPMLIRKVYKIKYAQEWRNVIECIDWKWFVFQYPRNTLLQHSKSMLNLFRPMQEVHCFGLFFYPAVISACFLIWRRLPNTWIVLTWFFVAFLFVEFGPLEINFGKQPLIVYNLIEKQSRYLTVLCAPAALLVGVWLQSVGIRYRRYIVVLLFSLLVGNCIICAFKSSLFFRKHTADLREASRFFQLLPSKRIYADWLAIEQLSFYSGFVPHEYIDIALLAKNPYASESRNSYVLIGGARGAGVIAEVFENGYAQLLEQIPKHWIELKTILGCNDVFRKRDLKIYSIP